ALGPLQLADRVAKVVLRDPVQPGWERPGRELRDPEKGLQIGHLHDVVRLDHAPPLAGDLEPPGDLDTVPLQQGGQRVGVAGDGPANQIVLAIGVHGACSRPGYRTAACPFQHTTGGPVSRDRSGRLSLEDRGETVSHGNGSVAPTDVAVFVNAWFT